MLRLLSALILVLFSHSAFADYQFSTYTFPGHMKVVVDPEQMSAPMVDYLFLIDDSGSMNSHQQNLANNIDSFVTALAKSGTDYHVGVTTTDNSDSGSRTGQFKGTPRVVTPKTAGALEAIRRNLLVGTAGSGAEEMFSPLKSALSEPLLSGVNAGFLREGARLSIIILSDAEDQSNLTPQESFDFLVHLKGDASLVTVNGMLVHSNVDESTCGRDMPNVPPLKLETLISLTQGELFGLCDSGIRSSLEKLVESTQPSVTRVARIPLMVTPKFDTVEVTYGDQLIPRGDIHRGWTFDHLTNEVLLGDEIEWSNQPANTPLEVRFVPLEWTL